jgi:hypothetical protein
MFAGQIKVENLGNRKMPILIIIGVSMVAFLVAMCKQYSEISDLKGEEEIQMQEMELREIPR